MPCCLGDHMKYLEWREVERSQKLFQPTVGKPFFCKHGLPRHRRLTCQRPNGTACSLACLLLNRILPSVSDAGCTFSVASPPPVEFHVFRHMAENVSVLWNALILNTLISRDGVGPLLTEGSFPSVALDSLKCQRA